MSAPRLHVTFKTHLDLGFTDDAHAVVDGYLDVYLPQAIRLARELRAEAPADRFVWTVGSWLLHEACDRLRGARLKDLEQAIVDGDLRWHALPFTMHSEWLDAGLVRHGLSLAKALDRRFGLTTRAAKMTDVPGHTAALVPLLAEAGVTLLHLGVNPASTVPAVAPWSRWRCAGAEVLLGYEGEYGGVGTLTGSDIGLAFGFTGDNLGPQPASEVRAFYAKLRAQYPGHTVAATGLEGFAADAAAAQVDLPVIDAEIGDTWIHGVGSDPEKTRRFRALARWRAALPADQLDRRELRRFSSALLMCGEHTWGRDVKRWNHAKGYGEVDGAWDTAGFAADRTNGVHDRLERSWQEQRAYLDQAITCLAGSPLQAAASAAVAWPAEPAGDWLPTDEATPHLTTADWELEVAGDGAVRLARHRSGALLADAGHPLAAVRYEVFGSEQYAAFITAYNPNYENTWRWGVPDFGKPGLEEVLRQSRSFTPRLLRAWRHADGAAMRLELAFDAAASSAFGCPRRWHLVIRAEALALAFDLRWYDKPATKIPEAMWLRFQPPLAGSDGLRLRKLGQTIDPRHVVAKGNRALHAVEALGWSGPGPQWNLELPDTGLVAPGGGALVDFRQSLPNPRDGIDVNLLNTTWGTNFPMWYQDDGVVRARLALG